MSQIRKILVPVDFSECSRAALDHAIELARIYGASLELLHVWEVPAFLTAEPLLGAGAEQNSLLDLVRNRANERLEALVAKSEAEGVHFTSVRCVVGIPHATIVDTAAEGHHDLIVVGSHGRTGLQRALLGSVAERVVRHAPCTVVVARLPQVPEPA